MPSLTTPKDMDVILSGVWFRNFPLILSYLTNRPIPKPNHAAIKPDGHDSSTDMQQPLLMLHTSHKVCIRDKQTVIPDSKFKPSEFDLFPLILHSPTTSGNTVWISFLILNLLPFRNLTLTCPSTAKQVPTCHTRCPPGWCFKTS